MILHIIEAKVCGPHHLRLTFNDGVSKRVDVGPMLHGPVFEPLRDPSYFARVELDEDFGVVQWPNGADFAPEALHALTDMGPVSEPGRGTDGPLHPESLRGIGREVWRGVDATDYVGQLREDRDETR